MNPVPRRFLLAAFGDPGHAFPAIALGKTLVERGHEVRLQTWTKWQEHAEREGMRFEPAPEYKVFPTADSPGLKPYQAAVRAARESVPLMEEFAPDAVVADMHGGLSRQLTMVATFPQLEYPRGSWKPWQRVVVPLMWEQPFGEVELPPGDDPLVLVAPSTSQDPEQRLLSATIEALAGEDVRVLASTNNRPPASKLDVPANTRLVD